MSIVWHQEDSMWGTRRRVWMAITVVFHALASLPRRMLLVPYRVRQRLLNVSRPAVVPMTDPHPSSLVLVPASVVSEFRP